jgi:hypothetical protein
MLGICWRTRKGDGWEKETDRAKPGNDNLLLLCHSFDSDENCLQGIEIPSLFFTMRCQARQRLMLLHLPTLSRRRIIGHLHGPSVRSQSTIASDPQQSSPPSPFRSRPRPRHTAALEAVATGMDVEVPVEPEMTAPTHRASRFSSRASTSIPPRGPASASSHSASRSSPDHRTPLLRANPNASNYTVSEAELDDTADFKEPIKEAPENHNLVLSTMDRLRRSLTRARTDQTNQLSARKLLKPASGSKRTISPLLHRGLRTKQVTTHLSPPSNRPTSTRRHEHRPDSSSDTTAPSATRRRVPVPRRIHMSPQEHLEVHIGYVEYVKTEPKTTTTGPEDLVTSHYPMAYSLLRDACPCPKCIHPSTRQKLHTTGQAHDAVMTSSFAAEVKDGTSIRATTDADSRQPGLEILWDSESSGFSGHRSFLPWSMIRLMARRRSPPGHYLHNQLRRLPWESAARLAETGYFRVAIEDIMLEDGRPSDEMLLNVLEQLQVHGLVIFEGVPIDPAENHDCMLRKVMGYIGELRNTFYGETWDVKSMAQSKNVAYTDLDLGLHMDLL